MVEIGFNRLKLVLIRNTHYVHIFFLLFLTYFIALSLWTLITSCHCSSLRISFNLSKEQSIKIFRNAWYFAKGCARKSWFHYIKRCFQVYYCSFDHNLSLFLHFSQYDLNTGGFLENFVSFLILTNFSRFWWSKLSGFNRFLPAG